MEKLFSKLPSWFIILLFIIGFSTAVFSTVYHYFTWPVTEGMIVGSVMTVSNDNSTFGYTHNYIEVSYEVLGDDRPHTADQQVLFATGHREGKKVVLHYNPNNHDEIVNTLFLRIMLPFIAVLWVFFINDIKQRRKRSREENRLM